MKKVILRTDHFGACDDQECCDQDSYESFLCIDDEVICSLGDLYDGLQICEDDLKWWKSLIGSLLGEEIYMEIDVNYNRHR